MLYSMKELLDHALANNYGVIAPSIRNEDCMRAAIEAAEELNSPVILNCLPVTWNSDFNDYELISFNVQCAIQHAIRTKVPVAINLDHGKDFDACAMAIHCGMTSVMLDKSAETLEENIRLTKEVVKMAHACGVSVEAELGHVGIANEAFAGADDSHTSKWSTYTNPEEAARFVAETGIDCLAVSIGNKHGPWANGIIPHIDFDVLQKIREAVPNTPLVLHGGSGTGDENLSKACKMGICKINVGTELETGAYKAVMKAVEERGNALGVFNIVREGYKAQIKRHMELFGSVGKAWVK